MKTIDMAFDDVGSGEPAYVLIHGAFGSRAHYSEQISYFSRKHRVIAMDLRGHGETPAPDHGYSITQFADDVASLCESVGVTRANIVGHSMGGVIAVDLGARYPDLVRAAATLDSPSIIPGWHESHADLYSDAMHGPNYLEVLQGFLDVASSSTDDEHRRSESMKAIEKMPHNAIIGTWDAIGGWNPIPALTELSMPILYLDHGQPDLDYALLRSYVPQVVTGQTVGAGHRALQEVPVQVNAMLDRFFANADVLADEARDNLGGYQYEAGE